MTINVTQKDIDEGIPKNCYDCPVARAIRKALKPDLVAVRERFIHLHLRVEGSPGSTSKQAFITPPAVRAFIDAFDEEQPVQPFTFELEKAHEVC